MENFASVQYGNIAGTRETHFYHPHKDQIRAERFPLSSLPESEGGYAGDVSPTEAYGILKVEADAVLVDVRTKPEWGFVGIPDLSSIGKSVGFIEWLTYPDMAVNESFVSELSRFTGDSNSGAVFFLCRSGQRSQKAAIAATTHGYQRAYNIEGGFEGALDTERHRGSVNGWKAAGLPWAQS